MNLLSNIQSDFMRYITKWNPFHQPNSLNSHICYLLNAQLFIAHSMLTRPNPHCLMENYNWFKITSLTAAHRMRACMKFLARQSNNACACVRVYCCRQAREISQIYTKSCAKRVRKFNATKQVFAIMTMTPKISVLFVMNGVGCLGICCFVFCLVELFKYRHFFMTFTRPLTSFRIFRFVCSSWLKTVCIFIDKFWQFSNKFRIIFKLENKYLHDFTEFLDKKAV